MLASETDDKIEQLRLGWFSILEKTDIDDPQNCFRIGLLKLGYSYARLVALSFGFQHAFGKSNTDENPFLNRVRHFFLYRSGRSDPFTPVYSAFVPQRTWLMQWWTMLGGLHRVSAD